MKAIAAAICCVFLVITGLAAQSHDNTKEGKSSAEIRFDTALQAGDVTLPAGDYRIVCDRAKVVFTRTLDGKRFELPCQGQMMPKKADQTRLVTVAGKNGERVISKLLLQGSNVEHVF